MNVLKNKLYVPKFITAGSSYYLVMSEGLHFVAVSKLTSNMLPVIVETSDATADALRMNVSSLTRGGKLNLYLATSGAHLKSPGNERRRTIEGFGQLYNRNDLATRDILSPPDISSATISSNFFTRSIIFAEDPDFKDSTFKVYDNFSGGVKEGVPFYLSHGKGFLCVDEQHSILSLGMHKTTQVILMPWRESYSCIGRGFCRQVEPRETVSTWSSDETHKLYATSSECTMLCE